MRICLSSRTIKLWLTQAETERWAAEYAPNSKLRGQNFHAWYGLEVDGFSTYSPDKPFGVGAVEAKDLRLIAWHHLRGLSGIEQHPEWSKIFWPKDHQS